MLLVATAAAFALALAALSGGRVTAGGDYADAAREVLLFDWWTLWGVAPVEFALIALLGVWLVVRIRQGETDRAPARYWYAGTALAVLILAVSSPIAVLAQGGLLAAHMMQHVLIGAVATLLVLLALPPRPPGHVGRLQPVLRRLAHPVPAFGLWALSTMVWFFPDLHHEVMNNVSLWLLQQLAFFGFGILLWVPILDRVREVPGWFRTGAKCGYMYGMFAIGLLFANIMWFSGTAFYNAHAAGAEAFGISPLQDQANAGTVMMVMHCLLAFGAIAVLFFRRAAADTGKHGDFGIPVPGADVITPARPPSPR